MAGTRAPPDPKGRFGLRQPRLERCAVCLFEGNLSVTSQPRPILTTDDHEHLQRLMTTLIGSRSPLAAIVRRKVHAAAIVDNHHVMPDLVTSGRRVRFAVNEGRSEEHTLTWANDRRSRVSTLSLQQPLGIALLGL